MRECQWREFAGCVGDADETECTEGIQYVVGPTEFGTFDLCTAHAERATDHLPEVKMQEHRWPTKSKAARDSTSTGGQS